jgi:subtilisin
MKRVALLLTVALAMTLACAGLALAQDDPTPSQGPPEGVIPGQYIVVFKEGVQDPTAVAREHAQRHGAEILFTYQRSIKGYAARFPEGRLDKVRADEQVAYVEPDKTAYARAQTLPWGINRIDADVSSTAAGNGSGAVSNVNAYIIDSGIYRHTDLNVAGHVNFAGGKNTDCNGHGTHVAVTVAAKDNTSYVVGRRLEHR